MCTNPIGSLLAPALIIVSQMRHLPSSLAFRINVPSRANNSSLYRWGTHVRQDFHALPSAVMCRCTKSPSGCREITGGGPQRTAILGVERILPQARCSQHTAGGTVAASTLSSSFGSSSAAGASAGTALLVPPPGLLPQRWSAVTPAPQWQRFSLHKDCPPVPAGCAPPPLARAPSVHRIRSAILFLTPSMSLQI